MLSVLIPNRGILLLEEVPGAPGDIMIVADHVYFNHVEESAVLEQVKKKPKK